MNYGLKFITLETGSKTIPPKKEIQKRKLAFWGGLEIAVKREAKSRGEKERYTHLNAQF